MKRPLKQHRPTKTELKATIIRLAITLLDHYDFEPYPLSEGHYKNLLDATRGLKERLAERK